MEDKNIKKKRSQHRNFNRSNNINKLKTYNTKRVSYQRNQSTTPYYYQKKVDNNDTSEIDFYQKIDQYFQNQELNGQLKIYFPKYIRTQVYNSQKYLVLENLLHKFNDPMELEISLRQPYQFRKPQISRTSFRIDLQDQIEKILKLYFEADTQGKIIIAIIDRLVMFYHSLVNNSIWNHLDLENANPRLLIVYEKENNNGTYLKILVKIISFKGSQFLEEEDSKQKDNNQKQKNQKRLDNKNEIIKGIKSLICHLINFYYFKFFLDG